MAVVAQGHAGADKETMMTSGGRRVRSGPAPDPTSRTSERRGYMLTSLPNTECSGRPPAFPLPAHNRTSDNPVTQARLVLEDERINAREKELWKWLWRQPQARAWKLPQYRYMRMELALWVRQSVVCESDGAKAADMGILLRMTDRIGLSPAGMAALGWRIESDERSSDSEFTRRRAEQLRAESAVEKKDDGGQHVYKRRLSG